MEILLAADIAAQPCHTLDTLQKDVHLQAVGLIGHEDHPTEGRTATLRASIRIDDGYLPRRTPAQPRGADTVELLEGLGFSPSEIADFIESGAAQTHPPKAA